MKFEIITTNASTKHISRINISRLIGAATRSTSRSLERRSSLSRSSSLARSPPQQQQQQQQRVLSPNTSNKVKRNLFGRLNHDLLKADLNEMWKDTIEKQKSKWNFDFDALCPLTSKQQNYEWTIASNDIPEFYTKAYKTSHKQQQQPSGSLNSSTNSNDDSLTEPIIQMRLRTRAVKSPRKASSSSSTKQRTLALTQANLIITYSENRKDTLRSSTKAKAKQVKQQAELASGGSEYKQQTLLEMFKQRKRRNNENEKSSKRSLFNDQPTKKTQQQQKIGRYFQTTTKAAV